MNIEASPTVCLDRCEHQLGLWTWQKSHQEQQLIFYVFTYVQCGNSVMRDFSATGNEQSFRIDL